MTEPTPLPDPGVATEEPPRPPRRGLWGALRGVIARYVRFVVRHRFLGCLFTLGLLFFLCVGTTLIAARFIPGGQDRAEIEELPVNEIATVVNEPMEPVEAYIAAMVEFDAQGMWDAYNDQAKAQLTARGGSPPQLQQGLDQARSAGGRYTAAARLGNYPLRDGRRYVFYILSRTGFPPSGGDEEVYFIFTVDPDGRILNVT